MYTLHVQPIRGKPYSQTLVKDSLTIGRSRSTDLVLNDEAISRKHARLYREDDQWFLEDLNSRNGTLVDNMPVKGIASVMNRSEINMSGNIIYITSDADSLTSPSSPFSSGTLLRSPNEILNSARTQVLSDGDEKSLRMVASRLSVLNEVHDALSKPISSEELLDIILDSIFKHLKPEEACIFLRGDENRLELAARKTIPNLNTKTLNSQTLIKEVAEGGMAAIVADIATDARFSASESMVNAGIRSLVAAPLLDNEGNLGMIALASRIAVRSFSEDDMALLVSLAALAALRIRNLKLMEESAQRLRDINIMLEQKVAERTAALEASNQELRKKNDAILQRQNQLVQQEKMASVGTMASGVAHLIKNPLNFVKNLSEVSSEMVEELQDILAPYRASMDAAVSEDINNILSDLKANCDIVHSHGTRADNIVVSIMEYSREPAKADRRLMDINALVEKYSQLSFHGKLPDCKADIKLEHDHSTSIGQVAIFAGGLSRTIMAMIYNAVEAIEEKARKTSQDYVGRIITKTACINGKLRISISDNGPGIPHEHRNQIFNPFFTTKHDNTHIGLGLSIGYDTIVQRHGGNLELQINDGWTTFLMELPSDAPPLTM